ncbi:alpha-d-galacturonidase [Flavobacterium yafengii]|uniref:Glycoside hydrolase family 20 zincin-like fold domain-containing protein n=1 Tax=Flavobacterium yafengii TaxID=3041253 RepID=A0AAW6TQX0_9FLAO|nr:glycoside hydrolase family 20 zincin-like fold domain-containing protein [Flavobacterium yafengii]MDI5949918.1 glycoside hydrolase family 20 zincin-like fold domain-containing protein [Flavobacterium yafengii]
MKYLSLLFLSLFVSYSSAQNITIVRDSKAARAQFGAEKLSEIAASKGLKVVFADKAPKKSKDKVIVIGEKGTDFWKQNSRNAKIDDSKLTKKEGFQIRTQKNTIYIEGTDATGTLYGAMELVDRIKSSGQIPSEINIEDSPEMVLRGSCIGVQKTTYLPGRDVYEYPYTPETFPWFYDKQLWTKYLDMMVDNRLNSLYLWNGHPFASLIKLKDYPFALEVSEEDFKKNEEIYKYLTVEANKRGIWVIQMFYNIIVSKPFAEHYNIKTQDRSRPITPEIADYTRKSIAAFIEKYPNVGLLVCLGEAINTIEDDVEWFTKTIIPGVQDGMKTLGRTDEPPIILRAHDTDAPLVMEKSLPLYKNLYTMHKYNGESLTTYTPRGPWGEIHKKLSSLNSVHISNVHILANLEPFRYGSPDFIQKTVKAMHNIHGANALHLYPQSSYWDWPYTADKTDKRLLEMDRDWIWYKAWARYAWESKRDRNEEIQYWDKQLADKFGTDTEAGNNILKAYEEAGEIAPKTLRRFGITEGNRQTLLLGMFESQLVNPAKWRVYPGFHESCGPVGELLLEYAKKEWNKEPHVGELPTQIIAEITQHGKLAIEAIDKAEAKVTKDKEEFLRLKNDMHAYKAFADFFSEKVKAAILVLRYSYSNEISDLDKALPHLEKSIVHYETLVNLTKDHYLYANSMQTAQRRIPIGGDDGNNKTWAELLPHYERELANFKRNIALLKSSKDGVIEKAASKPWQTAEVTWLSENKGTYAVKNGTKVYGTPISELIKVAPELQNLKGITFDETAQNEKGTHLKFKNTKAVKLVVGYFNSDQKRFLFPPSLETDAAGNAYGQAEVILASAMNLKELPRVNIHTYTFQPGENKLDLGKGKVLILGFIDCNQTITPRDVGYIDEGEKGAVDWLFY